MATFTEEDLKQATFTEEDLKQAFITGAYDALMERAFPKSKKTITSEESRAAVANAKVHAWELYEGTKPTLLERMKHVSVANMAESRIEKMVSDLKKQGMNCGYVVQGNAVGFLSPGAVLDLAPTPYSPADLDEAVKQNLLKKSMWNVSSTGVAKSWSFEMYTAV